MIVAAFLHDWFAWPNGAVLTNLVASAIWVSLAAWRLVKRLNRIHAHAEAAHEHAKNASRDAQHARTQATQAHNSAEMAHAEAKAAHDHAQAAHDHVVANVPTRRKR